MRILWWGVLAGAAVGAVAAFAFVATAPSLLIGGAVGAIGGAVVGAVVEYLRGSSDGGGAQPPDTAKEELLTRKSDSQRLKEDDASDSGSEDGSCDGDDSANMAAMGGDGVAVDTDDAPASNDDVVATSGAANQAPANQAPSTPPSRESGDSNTTVSVPPLPSVAGSVSSRTPPADDDDFDMADE
jgi:hypothetical protein